VILHGPLGGARLVLAALLCVTAGSSAWSQNAGRGEDGISLGNWLLAPFVTLTGETDDNIFRRAADAGPESDRITRWAAGVGASLPFRRSSLKLGYNVSDINYAKTDRLDPKLEHDAFAEISLGLASGDELTLRERYSRSSQDVQRVDPGGELVFDGRPFIIEERGVEITRRIPRRRGYTARLSRETFDYATGEAGGFFDFDERRVALEYREPITPHAWVEVAYEGGRSDQFRDEFRVQRTDQLLVGLRGELGKGQPFMARIGYEEFRFDSGPSGTFAGLVGSGEWRKRLGRGSLALRYQRRALPSALETYFVWNSVSARVEQSLPTGIGFGGEASASRSRYGDPVDWNNTCLPDVADADCPGSFRRDDDLRTARVWLDVQPRASLGFRLQASRTERDSNYERGSYDNTIVSVTVILGWFNR